MPIWRAQATRQAGALQLGRRVVVVVERPASTIPSPQTVVLRYSPEAPAGRPQASGGRAPPSAAIPSLAHSRYIRVLHHPGPRRPWWDRRWCTCKLMLTCKFCFLFFFVQAPRPLQCLCRAARRQATEAAGRVRVSTSGAADPVRQGGSRDRARRPSCGSRRG